MEIAVLNRNTDFVLDWLHAQPSAWDQVPLFNVIDTGEQAMNMGEGLEIKPFERIKQIPQSPIYYFLVKMAKLQNFVPFQ